MIRDDLTEDPLKELWQRAGDAADRGDFRGLISAWKALVDKGVWQLSARIGELYERGAEGVERNMESALTWYRRGIFEGDDPVAHVALGRAYLKGLGMKRDFAVALKHFQKARLSGLPEADIYLGLMYFFGAAVRRDLGQAREHLESAAAKDYFIAHAYLARLSFQRGHVLRGIKSLFRSWSLAVSVSAENPIDPRLLGLEKLHSSKLGLLKTILTATYTLDAAQ